MKKISFFIVLIILPFLNSNAQINVTSSNYVGIGTTNAIDMLTVNGNVRLSNANIPMGLMTECPGTANPVMDCDVNLISTQNNATYIGADFRIDSRNTSTYPIFQWLYRGTVASQNTSVITLMQLNSSGQLGIGQSPCYTLDLGAQTMRAGKYITASDSTLKTNIQNLTGALTSLLQLQGVTYKFKLGINKLSNNAADTSIMNRTQIGFISQNLGKVLPQLIFTDNNGVQGVDYQGVIPVIVEAAKEQNTVISTLQATLSSLQTSNTTLQTSNSNLLKSVTSLQTTVTSLQATVASLQAAVTALQKKTGTQ